MLQETHSRRPHIDYSASLDYGGNGGGKRLTRENLEEIKLFNWYSGEEMEVTWFSDTMGLILTTGDLMRFVEPGIAVDVLVLEPGFTMKKRAIVRGT